MKARQLAAAIHNAVDRQGDVAGCILHTDRPANFVLAKSTERFSSTQ
jgi:hypothetical protein